MRVFFSNLNFVYVRSEKLIPVSLLGKALDKLRAVCLSKSLNIFNRLWFNKFRLCLLDLIINLLDIIFFDLLDIQELFSSNKSEKS